jgi:hypothetical protein
MIRINLRIVYFVLVFIILLCSFYLLISGFGSSNLKLTGSEQAQQTSQSSQSQTGIEKTISELQNQISSLKNQISGSASIPNNSPDEPIINVNTLGTGVSGPISKPPPIIFDPIANYDQAKLFDPLVDPRGRTSADQIPAPQVAAQLNFPTQGVLDRYHRVGLLIAINTPYDNEGGRGKRPKRRHAKKRIDRYPDASSDLISSSSASSSDSDNSSMSSNNSRPYSGVETAPVSNEMFESFGNYMDEGPNGILELIGKKITDNWYKYFTSISKGNKIIKIVVNNRNRKELYTGDEVYIPELHRWYRVQIDEMDMIEYNPYLF